MEEPLFFEDAGAWRAWLEQHHADTPEVRLGFYRKASGKGGIAPAEAIEEALCFGWIDGIRHTRDGESYVNRYTPRRKGSNWSQVNIRTMERLIAEGRVHPAGLAAFGDSTTRKVDQYSFEQERAAFSRELEARFAAKPEAWACFQAQPPGWRRLATWWVMSAKRDETRIRRIDLLIDAAARGERYDMTGQARRQEKG